MPRQAGIKRKLMVMLLLTSAVVLIVTCAGFFIYEYSSFRSSAVRELATLGAIIASNSTAALAFQNQDDATEILSALRTERQIVRAVLYDKDGKLFSSYPAGMAADAFPAAPGKDGFRFARSHLGGFVPVVEGDKNRLGTLYIESDLRGIYERFRSYAAIVALVMAVALLTAYLLSSLLQRQISRPILALTDTAHTISEDRDYSVRATRTTSDELGRLTDAFNQMLAEIEEQTRALRESETEVKRLNLDLEERVHERTAQLEAAAAELESFSYSVSHDLRAPLRHVSGYVEMLTAATEGKLSDDAQRYLSIITKATLEMAQLIDDLLAFSRMGRVEMRVTRVSLDTLVRDALRSLQPVIQTRDIRWTISPLPDVMGDAAVLKQVLINLIDNALKYSRHRDTAEVEIGPAGEEAGRVIVFVRDNGAGFDMRYVHKLFGVFHRLHRADEFEGTGIGLATVRRIITRHGGRTWAEGELGKGATFYLTLEPATNVKVTEVRDEFSQANSARR